MVDKLHNRDELQRALMVVSNAGDLRIDLRFMVKARPGVTVSVSSLLEAISKYTNSHLKMSWDGVSLLIGEINGEMTRLEVIPSI